MKIPKPLSVLGLIAALYGLSCSVADAETLLAVRFGSLLTPQTRLHDAVVLVRDDRIESILPAGKDIPAGYTLVDLHTLTGLPGLIDVHTHMTYYWDHTPGTTPWSESGKLHSAVSVYLAGENAMKSLETGVTTVRDMHASNGNDLAMRELIKRGAMKGPRMFVVGCGLHVPLSFDPEHPMSPADSPCEVSSQEQVRRAGLQQLAAGADWIKMFGSTGSAQDVSGKQTFSLQEMQTAAETAHRAGKKLAVHSYGPEGAHDAVLAGADSVEHAIDIDEGTLKEMARRGTVYVPTISHNQYYIDHRAEYSYDQKAVDGLTEYISKNIATVRRAKEHHVKIAMGSDAVFTGFGENTRELDFLVRAGLTPTEALASATTVAAELLGKSGELGVIVAGAYADLVAVEGDPMTNIADIHTVKWVMKGGQVMVDKR